MTKNSPLPDRVIHYGTLLLLNSGLGAKARLTVPDQRWEGAEEDPNYTPAPVLRKQGGESLALGAETTRPHRM